MNNYNIYVTESEQKKIYVGKTKNPKKRLKDHYNNNGSSWSKLYEPKKTKFIFKHKSKYDELKYTLIMMFLYDIENVRGGPFVQRQLPKKYDTIIKKLFRDMNRDNYYDKCDRIKEIFEQIDKNNENFEENPNKFYEKLGLEEKDENVINDMLNNLNDKCYECGKKGHFGAECHKYS